MKEYHSIFNHTLAPITPGPSSSNTCGPARIALFAHRMFGGIPKKAVIEYSKFGAFPTSMFGMKSDFSFVNGLLGKDQNAPDYKRCYECAAEAGMEVSFREVEDLTIGGYEAARLRLFGEDGSSMVLVGESLGGGSFLMHSIDDVPVESHGAYFELFVMLKDDSEETAAAAESVIVKAVEEDRQEDGQEKAPCADITAGQCKAADIPHPAAGSLCGTVRTSGGGRSILQAKFTRRPGEGLLQKVREFPGVLWARGMEPVVPEVILPGARPPFETAAGMIEYCEKAGRTPAQAAVDYEIAVSGWSGEQVCAYAAELLAIMREGETAGTKTSFTFPGILSQKGPELRENMAKYTALSMGFLDEAIPAALGVMEYSNASGKIVCVPTGGSSGIVPGLLLSAARAMDKTERELADALLVSGLTGVLMMIEGNNFSGGMTGCQAEIGCGTAMAAAGLAAMMGGSAKQVCDAACMGLQSFFGLVCDPVCGFVQVPCLTRNMAAVSVAATCARTVLAGFDVLIPLDEMIVSFIDGGRTIMSTIGIGKGGCCATPTAKRLKEERASKK